MFRFVLAWLAFSAAPLMAAGLKVAVLHPLLGDIARRVGGDHVQVIDLIGPNGDPHHFEPKPDDLRASEGAAIYLVAGMGLEGYLPKLKAVVSNHAKVIEVGATLPALEGTCGDEDHGSHDHDHEVDPHWWHSIDLFRRATSIVAEVLVAEDPDHAVSYQQNAEIYRKELDGLQRWAKREIAKISRENRHLATTHAAFNYFCKDFGFTAHPVQGLNREQMPDPKQLAALVADLKANHVMAIFPEKESNPKILKTLTQDTGIKLAKPLIADGVGVSSYEEMVRHNISTIVEALAR